MARRGTRDGFIRLLLGLSSTAPASSLSLQERCQRLSRFAISAGNRVGIDVESGRRASVAEPLGDSGDGNAGRQHLGRHEVTQVVQPEMRQSGGTSRADEALR